MKTVAQICGKIYGTCTKFSAMLGFAFIILKLCYMIDWAWIWVLAPIWIPFALIIAFVGFMLFIDLIIIIIATFNRG